MTRYLTFSEVEDARFYRTWIADDADHVQEQFREAIPDEVLESIWLEVPRETWGVTP